MKVYLVGHQGPEHHMVFHCCKTRELALIKFEEIRLELLEDAKEGLTWSIKDAKEHLLKSAWYDGSKFDEGNIAYFKKIAENGSEMYLEIIEKLKETDPEKIDNYPQDTPFIEEMEVLE